MRNGNFQKTIVRDLKQRIKLYKYRATTPRDLKNNDTFIVEFPKSGITWLCTLIINYVHAIEKRHARASLFNVNQFIQGVHVNQNISEYTLPGLHCRLIKSHSEYNPLYNNVIYLLRNPVSVMESYYRYCIDLSICEMTFYEFVRSNKFGVGQWKSHVESWLMKDVSPAKLHLIKYEDILNNGKKELSELFSNMGLLLNDEVLEDVLVESSLGSMREKQSLYSKHNPAFSLEFVRKNKEKFDSGSEAREYVLSECSELVERFYPELD